MKVGVDKGNRARAWAFRNEVLLFLHEIGFDSARAPSDGEPGATRDQGAIVGLPWTLDVHCQQTIDLSGAQTEVERKARLAGTESFASIQKRKSHPTRDAYVTMPLHVFAAVLRRA